MEEIEFDFTEPLESEGWASVFEDDEVTGDPAEPWLAVPCGTRRGRAADACVAVLGNPGHRSLVITERRATQRRKTQNSRASGSGPKKPRTHRVARGVLALVALVGLLSGIAGVCERAPDTAQAQFRPVAAAPTAPAADAAYVPIEQVQLGQRLMGANPLADDVELEEPDPAQARTVVLEALKPDGQLLQAELIWPLELIDEVGATVGGQIEVTFGEIETTGTARVVAIEPCPELETGPGTLVVGRYRHDVADAPMVDLTLDDGSESVEVTANHPYWSVDRQDFTPAGQLRVGETVDTLSGTAHVAAARSYRFTGTVYNLETTEHVYLAGSDGTLVHNSKPCLLGRNGNRSTGEGRVHVAYQGTLANGQPYSGYASAPKRLGFKTALQVIKYRYGNNFSRFKGSKGPDRLYFGRDASGKNIARGLEHLNRGSGNVNNPVSRRNDMIDTYLKAAKRWQRTHPQPPK